MRFRNSARDGFIALLSPLAPDTSVVVQLIVGTYSVETPDSAASTCVLRSRRYIGHVCDNSTSTMNFSPAALGVALLLSGHGLRKKSLSLSGAAAAFLAGYAHLANPLKLFGVSLIVFYLLGSRATKVRSELPVPDVKLTTGESGC